MRLTDALLLLLLLGSAITDLRSRRILNAFTYPAIVVGLVLNFVEGWGELGGAASACLISAAVYYPLCRAGGMGFGDLKLMAAIGALMGLEFWFRAQVASAVVGGAAALALAAYKGVLKATLLGSISIMRGIWLAVFRRRVLQMPRSALGHPIPYGAAIAAGTAAVWIYYRWPW